MAQIRPIKNHSFLAFCRIAGSIADPGTTPVVSARFRIARPFQRAACIPSNRRNPTRNGRSTQARRLPKRPQRLGDANSDDSPSPRHDSLGVTRQVNHHVEAPTGRHELRRPEKGATRPQSLRLRPRHLVGRPIRSLEFVGLDASPLGPPRGPHNATLRRTHERRPQRRLLGRQSPNRLGIARSNDQTLEYARSKQIYDYGKERENFGVPRI